MTFLVAIPPMLAAAWVNYAMSGTWTLLGIVISLLLITCALILKLRNEFVYRQDLGGSLKRFILGTTFSVLLAIPYGLKSETILLAIIIFLAVNLISIPFFTYTTWLNLDDAGERLLTGDNPFYGHENIVLPDCTITRSRIISGDTMKASPVGKLAICGECLSLVGDDDYCWRCGVTLDDSSKLYATLPIGKQHHESA